MGGCHIEEGAQEGNLNRLEGGEGVGCMDCGAPLIHASKT